MPSKPMPVDQVIKEFPPVGKYRIRLLANKKTPGQPFLDVREFVTSDAGAGGGFEGFTRRGIRISDRAHLDLLRSTLDEILKG